MKEFIVKYAQSIVALVVALAVLWFLLYMVQQHAPGVIGKVAGIVGARATGQDYKFNG